MSPSYFKIALNGPTFHQVVIYTCYAIYACFSLAMVFDQSKMSTGLLPLGHSQWILILNFNVKKKPLTFYIMREIRCSSFWERTQRNIMCTVYAFIYKGMHLSLHSYNFLKM